MNKLLDVTIKELDRVGLAQVDVDTVLRKARISKGSLYHHFQSKNGLLAAAEAEQFMRTLRHDSEMIYRLIEECKTKQDFVDLIATVMKITSLKENYEFRKQRIRAIAMSVNDENLALILKTAQTALSIHLATSFQIAKDRSWLKEDLDVLALSNWIQGVFIGHIMLDITGITEYDESWNQLSFLALQSFLTAD